MTGSWWKENEAAVKELGVFNATLPVMNRNPSKEKWLIRNNTIPS